jgi:hypothetical protein
MLACIAISSFTATPTSCKAATKSNQNIKIHGIETVAQEAYKIESRPVEDVLDCVAPRRCCCPRHQPTPLIRISATAVDCIMQSCKESSI